MANRIRCSCFLKSISPGNLLRIDEIADEEKVMFVAHNRLVLQKHN